MISNRRLAFEIPGGHLVRHQDRLWVKAERPSKDYVNHYLVGVHGTPELTLFYIDPETELELVSPRAVLGSEATARTPGEQPRPGDLLICHEGRYFIKALDVKKDGQRHLAFVDLQSGLVRFRPDSEIAAVFSAWMLVEDR